MVLHQTPRKRNLGSYPIMSIVLSTMLALLVIGLFGLLLLHASKLSRIIRENVQVQVYLNKYVTETQTLRIQQVLHQKEYVLRQGGHPQLHFLSKEAVAQKFVQETGENFLNVLDRNPLRAVYLVHITPSYQDEHQLQYIKQELEELEGVFEVDYIANFVASMNSNIIRIGIALGSFAMVLLMAAVVLMHNTIKLAIYAQRFLIRSMDLVGATPAFIRKPFVLRGVLVGLLAGTMADSLLLLLLHYANKQATILTTLQEPAQVFALLGGVLSLGVLVSFLSTYNAVNRYLRMSLDDLY
ncbi:MAG: permease-like cell division protein FtsX [Bacteroidota bacterium]